MFSAGKTILLCSLIIEQNRLFTPQRSRLLPGAVQAIDICSALYRKGLFVDYGCDAET